MDTTLSRRYVLLGLTAAGLVAGVERQLRAESKSAKETRVKRIFITGSTEGLGLAAARTLMDEGHEVVLHARSQKRAAAIADIVPRSGGLIIGDLSSAAETHSIAEQVNKMGRMDTIIHNAGVYLTVERGNTPEGHATVLAVNTLDPQEGRQRLPRLTYLRNGFQSASGILVRAPFESVASVDALAHRTTGVDRTNCKGMRDVTRSWMRLNV